jgi:hypothetical protein
MRQSLFATIVVGWEGFVCRGMVGLWILETRMTLVILLATLQATPLVTLLEELRFWSRCCHP